jgi:glycosyltransferase involved in cell wall biosynthesis
MTGPATAYVLLWFPKPSETFVFREAAGLAELGLDLRVHTLYGQWRDHLSPEMAGCDLAVERLGTAHLRSGPRDLVYWKRRRPEALRTVRRALPLLRWGTTERTLENLWAMWCGFTLARRFQEAGVEHIHSPWAGGPATAALVASLLTGIPFSFAARANDIHPAEPALGRKISHAAFVRVNTAVNLDYVRGYAPTAQDAARVHLIYNPLTLTPAEPPQRNEPRPPCSLLALGRLVPKKGCDVLLRACAALAREGADFTLTIAGDGPERGRLERLARELALADRVRFAGFVSHDAVPGLLADADALVMPSVVSATGDRDGIPNVIMEALALQTPVVASDVSGIREVVRHGETGLLAPQRDPDALAGALRRIMAEPDAALAMARRGRELVLERFDPRANLERLASLFAEHALDRGCFRRG